MTSSEVPYSLARDEPDEQVQQVTGIQTRRL